MHWIAAVSIFIAFALLAFYVHGAKKRERELRLWWRVDGFNEQGNPVWATAATQEEALQVYLFHEGFISRIQSIKQIDMGMRMR